MTATSRNVANALSASVDVPGLKLGAWNFLSPVGLGGRCFGASELELKSRSQSKFNLFCTDTKVSRIKSVLAKSLKLGCALDHNSDLTQKVPSHDVINALLCRACLKILAGQ